LREIDNVAADAGATQCAHRRIVFAQVAQHGQRTGKILIACVVVDRDDRAQAGRGCRLQSCR